MFGARSHRPGTEFAMFGHWVRSMVDNERRSIMALAPTSTETAS